MATAESNIEDMYTELTLLRCLHIFYEFRRIAPSALKVKVLFDWFCCITAGVHQKQTTK